LGLLLPRLGQPQEGLRYLAEANRVNPGCPLVTCQLGICLAAANSDSGTAVRTLQRALGPKGLATWRAAPQQVWVEALPEGHSFIRLLAAQHRFICPLLGPDMTLLLRQGQLALAQAHYRLDACEAAATLFNQLLQEGPPSTDLLRGLGLSLARLGR